MTKVRVRKGMKCPKCFGDDIEHFFSYIDTYEYQNKRNKLGYDKKEMELNIYCNECKITTTLHGDVKNE